MTPLAHHCGEKGNHRIKSYNLLQGKTNRYYFIMKRKIKTHQRGGQAKEVDGNPSFLLLFCLTYRMNCPEMHHLQNSLDHHGINHADLPLAQMKRILILNDIKVNLKVLDVLLTLNGYNTTSAINGKNARKVAPKRLLSNQLIRPRC